MSRISEAIETGMEIAVIGMSGRFPGARDIHEFWNNLKEGKDCISFFSDEELAEAGVSVELLKSPAYIKAKGLLEHKEEFDASFFDYIPKDALIMDPQVRIFHEGAWSALEDAGYNPYTYHKLIGCYSGASNHFYWEARVALAGNRNMSVSYETEQLAAKEFLSTRIAYKLNLKGPAVNVQTACSTSLVTVAMACQGLLSGECDMALAGGVTATGAPKGGYQYHEGMIMSPDGHCRAFDSRSQGTIFGGGAGCVVLKRLEDALLDRDFIYAVIKSTALNNDGLTKAAFTAPSAEGQAKVIRTALQAAEVESESISYVETFGTGTSLGDPVEIEGLKLAFATPKKGFCAIGSVKTNVGHLDIAAGIAGFIKTVLALHHRLIPPSLHFETPNPKIAFEDSPFYVNTRLKEWKNDSYPLRAGVSSFGIGGTNAHAILEEAPPRRLATWPAENTALEPATQYQIILLSARTEPALERATANLANYFEAHPHIHLADAAYTLQVGRRPFEHRKMLTCASITEALQVLKDPESEKSKTFFYKGEKRPIMFMFPGQGSQYVNMGRDLYQSELLFREEMDRCFEILKPLMEFDLKEILYPPDPVSAVREEAQERRLLKIHHTQIAQPLLFSFEYALSKLLMHLGLHPDAMIGHSIGEYVAAHLSGVMSLEDALTLVSLRGNLMQHLPPGAMLSVSLPEESLVPLLNEEISLAEVNSSALCVVSGPHEAIARFDSLLEQKGIERQRLHTSHAFHSAMMDPLLKEFQQAAGKITLKNPAIPYISNITGGWASPQEAASPHYWSQHIRRTVRFGDGLRQLFHYENALFLEPGPGKTLSTFVRQHKARQPSHLTFNLVRHPQEKMDDNLFFLNQLGQVWISGGSVDWSRYPLSSPPPAAPYRIPLPTYSFEPQSYWLETGALAWNPGAGKGISNPGQRNEMTQWFYIPSWKRTGIPTPGPLGKEEAFPGLLLIFPDDSGFALKLVKQIQSDVPKPLKVILVKKGNRFAPLAADTGICTINPRLPEDYDLLLKEVEQATHNKNEPLGVLHLWNVSEPSAAREPVDILDDGLYWGFYSLIFLAGAIGRRGLTQSVQISVFTDRLQDVAGETETIPVKSTLLGPVKVIPMEYPNITCRSIDILLPSPYTPQEDRLLRQLTGEWFSRSSDPLVVFRRHHRFVPAFEPVRLEGPGSPGSKLKNGGVYLLTGGLGGIGLILTRCLVQTAGSNLSLIFTTHSPFPPETQWQEWLLLHHESDPISIKIRLLLELKAIGTGVTVIPADVTDYQQMQAVISQGEQQFGPINGVFHCAGLPGGGIIQLKTPEMAARVLAPKVKGTLVLDAVFKNKPLDFLVFCSSINAIVPMPGQVDYTAANAFLDTYGQYQCARNHRPVLSINWDRWQGVGMAAPEPAPTFLQLELDHPLLDHHLKDSAGRDIFATLFRMDRHWVLKEHRTRQKGVIPGTTYLEMVRAAVETLGHSGTLEIADVYFVSPLLVGESETRESWLILATQAKGYRFQVKSREIPGPADQWQEHARGTITLLPEQERILHDLREIEAHCGNEEIIRTQPQKNEESPGEFLHFGPRWQGLRKILHNQMQGLAHLELPGTFAGDLLSYRLHPSLLDTATGFLSRLLGKDGFYMPLSYRKIKVKGPLTRQIFSHSRLKQNQDPDHKLLEFDITILNAKGEAVLEVESFTMLRFTADILERINAKAEKPPSPGSIPAVQGKPGNPEGTADADEAEAARQDVGPRDMGLRTDEGREAWLRLLGSHLSQVVVSTTDLETRIKRSSLEKNRQWQAHPPASLSNDPADAAVPSLGRPELSTIYVKPQTGNQQRLAEIWEKFLGIRNIGIKDDFFELGGDSLKIIALVGRIHKTLNIEIPFTEFLNHPTIEKLAEYISHQDESQFDSINPAEKMEYYPLASAQKRIYYVHQQVEENVSYNLFVASQFEGELEMQRMNQVLHQLIKRHDAFRTYFLMVAGEPVQRVKDEKEVQCEVEFYNLEGKIPESGENTQPLQMLIHQLFIRPFALSQPPLIRVGLMKITNRKYIVVVDIHHIITDHLSLEVFFKEFVLLYQRGVNSLPQELRLQYKDYSQWQNNLSRDTKSREKLKKQETYWLNRFNGTIPQLELPTDYPRSKVPGFEGDQINFQLGKEFIQVLEHFTRQTEVTSFMVLLAVLYILLYKYSGQEDIIIGVPATGRTHGDLENLMGVFINMIALRNQPTKDKTFEVFLEEVKESVVKGYENQDYQFNELIQKLGIPRHLNRNPLFNVEYTLVPLDVSDEETVGKGWKSKRYELDPKTSKFDLRLGGYYSSKVYGLSLRYSTKLFKKATVERMKNRYLSLLETVLKNPALKLEEITLSHELLLAQSTINKEKDGDFDFN